MYGGICFSVILKIPWLLMCLCFLMNLVVLDEND
jgi:hypothetical protein